MKWLILNVLVDYFPVDMLSHTCRYVIVCQVSCTCSVEGLREAEAYRQLCNLITGLFPLDFLRPSQVTMPVQNVSPAAFGLLVFH